MEWLVSPVLHNNVPVTPVAVKTELPQLFITLSSGASVIGINGAAVALAAILVHPSTVCDTVYIPPVVTVIELAVSPLLHNKVPVTPVAVNKELPQLLTTDIPGVGGTDLGATI